MTTDDDDDDRGGDAALPRSVVAPSGPTPVASAVPAKGDFAAFASRLRPTRPTDANKARASPVNCRNASSTLNEPVVPATSGRFELVGSTSNSSMRFKRPENSGDDNADGTASGRAEGAVAEDAAAGAAAAGAAAAGAAAAGAAAAAAAAAVDGIVTEPTPGALIRTVVVAAAAAAFVVVVLGVAVAAAALPRPRMQLAPVSLRPS